MKGKRALAIGLVAGVVLTMSVQVFADPIVEMVQAKINPQYYITIDGQKKDLTEENQILIYKDRTYVPVRFVSEELDATVTWHEDTKEIEITSAKIPETPDVSQPESPDTTNTYDYKAFPLTKETENYKIEAFMYGKDQNNGKDQKVWFRVTNKSDNVLKLDQAATVVVENGKTYSMDTKYASDFDKRWYSDLQKDDKVEGYILLPEKIVEPKNLHMELKLIWNNSMGTKEVNEIVNFDLKL